MPYLETKVGETPIIVSNCLTAKFLRFAKYFN